jgi:uncharacterized protein YkwD
MRTIAALTVSVALAVSPPATAAAAGPAETTMVRTINAIRYAHDLPRLRPADSLFVSARRYARRMMRTDYFGHLARIPVSPRWHTAGEALEWHTGWRLRPRRAVELWMASPEHRRLLLSRRFKRIGVGAARGYYKGAKATMWVAHLASP